jgi:hypothetical protein
VLVSVVGFFFFCEVLLLLTASLELRVRSLYAFEGDGPEDLCELLYRFFSTSKLMDLHQLSVKTSSSSPTHPRVTEIGGMVKH